MQLGVYHWQIHQNTRDVAVAEILEKISMDHLQTRY